jgi:hypothetical protein
MIAAVCISIAYAGVMLALAYLLFRVLLHFLQDHR